METLIQRQGVRLMRRLADAIYPRICPGCGEASDRDNRHICWACFAQIELFTESMCEVCGRFVTGGVRHQFVCSACRAFKPAFERARSAGHFSGFLRDRLHAFKYNGALWLKDDLVDLLEGCLRASFEIGPIDVVVPIPLHALKMRERNYNQAALLAEGLAARIGRRYDGRSVKRVVQTETQTHLHAAERRENMRGAFAVVRPEWIRSRTVLLVDDVMTTGSTLDACARALTKAGARRVWAVTVARGIR